MKVFFKAATAFTMVIAFMALVGFDVGEASADDGWGMPERHRHEQPARYFVPTNYFVSSKYMSGHGGHKMKSPTIPDILKKKLKRIRHLKRQIRERIRLIRQRLAKKRRHHFAYAYGGNHKKHSMYLRGRRFGHAPRRLVF